MTTHHQLWNDSLVQRSLPALASAAATVGGWQTQAAGTIGGNVCNASPAADTVAPLLVANARAVLSSTAGTREIALDDFVVGRRSTARRSDELLTELTMEPLPSGAAEVYLKVGPRSAMEVAVVGLAVRIARSGDGRVIDARIALASVAPTVFRVTEAETLLIGSSLDDATVAAAGDILFATARPVDDARATASYRQRVLPQLLGRAIRQCTSQTSGS
jgi:carbon-monoxide dehydrogenase medium subunit